MKIEIGKQYNVMDTYGSVDTVHVVRKSWIPFRYLCVWIFFKLRGRITLKAGYKWSWEFISKVQ